MRAFVNGAFEDIESGRVRVGNAWKNLASVRVYAGGAWREGKSFVPPLTVSVSPADVFGSSDNFGTAYTTSATATPSGGVPPYTYSWARLGGGLGAVDSPSFASTGFLRGMGFEESATETFQVTVTDSTAQTATANVTANFTSFGFFSFL